ncbi:hypothetical protein L6164_024522 [Bauhinia variegata]|uniref:Uncharacterized protein n=1 Tax=Bauhinia variegata TaxID=167791 RepID=A0ACB9LY38_BAUVA|nr:hypothetical protein L6164_024522 [Bauhinia variegata]
MVHTRKNSWSCLFQKFSPLSLSDSSPSPRSDPRAQSPQPPPAAAQSLFQSLSASFPHARTLFSFLLSSRYLTPLLLLIGFP